MSLLHGKIETRNAKEDKHVPLGEHSQQNNLEQDPDPTGTAEASQWLKDNYGGAWYDLASPVSPLPSDGYLIGQDAISDFPHASMDISDVRSIEDAISIVVDREFGEH